MWCLTNAMLKLTKTTKDKRKNRAEMVDRALFLSWDSCQSHLRWTHKKSAEGTAFHKKCVQDYCELMYLLSNLY